MLEICVRVCARMERWRLPIVTVTNYAIADCEAMRRFDAHMRAYRRRQLWHQWAIALGWREE